MNKTSTNGTEERLDVIARLLAALVTKDMNQKDSVLTLAGAGLASRDIGDILGLSANHVNAVLSKAKKSAKA